MVFALKTRCHGRPSHYYADGGRLIVGDVGQKLKGILVQHVSFMYQKMSKIYRTTKTHTMIEALKK
jgi:hypothetical protein